jgi:5-formyltetrahydrofolate cyclo-ligase
MIAGSERQPSTLARYSLPPGIDSKATERLRFVNNRMRLGYRRRAEQSMAATERLLGSAPVRAARVMAAYWPFGTEPDTRHLISAFQLRGGRVLLPVLLPDRDLDWAWYPGEPASGTEAAAEPIGPLLGVESVLRADVVITPALAVTPNGVRLGRGGGSYDRVLARIAAAQGPRPWTCALLYDAEIGAARAVEPHDRAVDAACSGSGLVAFGEQRPLKTVAE